MNRKNITGTAILGVSLLGTLWALGQEVPPRPRPVMPPEAEGTLEVPASSAVRSITDKIPDNKIAELPAIPSVTTLPEPKGAPLPPWPKEIPTSLSEPKGGAPEPEVAPSPPVLSPSPAPSPVPTPLPVPAPNMAEPLTPPSQIQQIQAIQRVEKKSETPPTNPPVMIPSPLPPVETPLPVPPVASTTPPLPLPVPTPPAIDPGITMPTPQIIPTPALIPMPIEPPNVTPPVIPPATPPVVSEPKGLAPPAIATPTPWNPAENTKVAPKFPPLPQIAEPTPPAGEPPSRFIVPPKTSQLPAPTPAAPLSVPNAKPPLAIDPVAPPGPTALPQPQQTDVPYFQMVKRWRQPDAAPRPPAVLPKIENNSRPPEPITNPHVSSNSHLHGPAVDPSGNAYTPQITVEKRGPFYHKTGSMKYQIALRNVGSIVAQNVRVEDEIPGAQVIATTPIADQQLAERLIWVLPTMRPGEERVLQEELQPARPGDVVSTTSVHVYAATNFRTRVDADAPIATPKPIAATPVVQPGPPFGPMPSEGPIVTPNPVPNKNDTGPSLDIPSGPGGLSGNGIAPGPVLTPSPADAAPAPKTMPMTVEVKALPVVGVGQTLVFEVIVTNKSLLPLTGMMLYGKVPDGFSHPRGESIGADLPNLAPGDTKSYKMPMTAVAAGKYTVEIRVTAAPNFELVARPTVIVEATGLALTQQVTGGRLFLGKDNDIKITVVNNQPTPITQVQLVDVIPDGLEYVNSSDRGYYQPNNRTITWLIESLPAGGTRTVVLRVQPKTQEPITHEVAARIGGTNSGSPDVKSSATYAVETFSTLQVQLQARDSVLEAGKETLFVVRITNSGTSPATNIHVGLTPTDGLEFGGQARAPTAFRMNGKEILFAPIPQLAPGATAIFQLGLKGIAPGDQRVRLQVASDQMRTILIREEATKVYRDR